MNIMTLIQKEAPLIKGWFMIPKNCIISGIEIGGVYTKSSILPMFGKITYYGHYIGKKERSTLVKLTFNGESE